MKLRFFFNILLTLLTTYCVSNEINYSHFSSLEEVVAFETEKILLIPDSEIAFDRFANAFLDRGETFTILGDFNNAINDINNGLYYANLCQKTDKDLLICRGLFNLCLIYGAADRITELTNAAEEFNVFLANLHCDDCQQGNDCDQERDTMPSFFAKSISKNVKDRYLLKCNSGDKPIYGPDRVSVEECLDFVDGTRTAAADLIILCVKRTEVQLLFFRLIDGLANTARNCCRAGGIWKACLQPLVNKWQAWNQKWKILGIPADPNWD